jgi:hypothetical protein
MPGAIVAVSAKQIRANIGLLPVGRHGSHPAMRNIEAPLDIPTLTTKEIFEMSKDKDMLRVLVPVDMGWQRCAQVA